MQKPKVWIIQNDFNKLEQALNDIDKNSINNYLYTNCLSKFMFDEVDMFSKNFDAFLYCEDTNTYIIFSKDSKNELMCTIQYLLHYNINFHEISLKNKKEDIINKYPNTLHDFERNKKELWVVNNTDDLINILKAYSQEESKQICAFYPFVNSKISLNYANNYNKQYSLNEFLFSGIIITPDKRILITRENIDDNTINIPVKEICDKLGIDCKVFYSCRPKFINTAKKLNKRYCDYYF